MGDVYVYTGLNSIAAVSLTSTLEARLGIQLPPTLAFDFPTITAMVEYIAAQDTGLGHETQSEPAGVADSAAVLAAEDAPCKPVSDLAMASVRPGYVAITAMVQRAPG